MRKLALAGLCLLVAAGCGAPKGPQEITMTRTGVVNDSPTGGGMDTAARMGMGGGMPPAAASPRVTYTTPEGWEEQPAGGMRLASFTIGDGGECTVIRLSQTGGGLAANVNRWRAQMNMDPLDEAGVDALPKAQLVGLDGVNVMLEGAYKGMGDVSEEGYALAGRIAIDDNASWFVKLTGPAELVKGELEKLNAFCDGLTAQSADPHAGLNMPSGMAGVGVDGMGGMPGGMAGGMAGGVPVGGFEAGDFKWDAPEGWQETEKRPMRVVNFQVDGAECYVTLLGGAAGGVEANINRWQGQMGQPALSDLELAALPKITVMGQEVSLAAIKGNFSGIGADDMENSGMLGVVCPLGDQTLFVKMIGPEATIEQQVENFKAFCASLR